ncbi:hypothetical protein Rhal01_03764 [Rubritalea halochordaticola]|uniref:DUF2314 domain-containing protein n=1 Tax=Rubritalea halochordaticola TaxID=714537 RepID=A0ABP9V4G9_9BACT
MSDETEEDIQVMAISRNDPEFTKATKEALKRIGFFIDTHKEHSDNLGVYFAIKYGVTEEDGSRTFLWYTFEKLEKGLLHAYHYSIPESLKAHEKIQIKPEDISDWMINDHGHLHGGWSVRIQRSRLPESEQAEFDEGAGIKNYLPTDF